LPQGLAVEDLPAGRQVNKLLQHVERTWEKVSDGPVDTTSNVTERMIGLTSTAPPAV